MRSLVAIALVVVVGFVAGPVVLPASAAFTRPSLGQIKGTPTGAGGAIVPFSGPEGVTVDDTDDIWVGDGSNDDRLDEFEPAYDGNNFLKMFIIEAFTFPESLAFDNVSKYFYFSGQNKNNETNRVVEVFNSSGDHVEIKGWEGKRFAEAQRGGVHVAIDNSTDLFDLSAGSVYVAHSGEDDKPPVGDGLPQGIEKFNAMGESEDFVNTSKEPVSLSYVKGNEITGVPDENFSEEAHASPASVAVDEAGNIYAVDLSYNSKSKSVSREGAAVEFSPEGVFLRAFTGEDTPGIGEDHEGFGGELRGVAIDPATGDVLISVYNPREGGVVDEFGPSGGFVNQITGFEVSPGVRVGLKDPSEMVVDSRGDLYVVDGVEHVVDVFGPGLFYPSLKLSEASAVSSSEASLVGSVNPEGLELSECRFEYVTESVFLEEGFSKTETRECVPSASKVSEDVKEEIKDGGDGRVPVGVGVTLKGLLGGVTYRYRLVARTAGAAGGVEVSEPLGFTTSAAPRLVSSSVSNVSSSFVDLNAEIGPFGLATSYRFEYDTRPYVGSESHGVSVPVPDASIGSGGVTGGTIVSVVQQVAGLQPGTTYYYRVVAENSSGVTRGAVCGGVPASDCTFSTLPLTGEGLPDGRAYELVTPSNKGSAEDMFGAVNTGYEYNDFNNFDVGYSSEEGEEFLLETRAAFGSFAAAANNLYVFKRDEQDKDWLTIPVASPSLGVQSFEYTGDVFDPSSFSSLGVSDKVGAQASSSGLHDLSLVGPPGGPYTEIHNENYTEKNVGTLIVGASYDLSDLILESTDHTLASNVKGQDPDSHTLYEWANGKFTPVSMNTKGTVFQCGAVLGQGIVSGSRHNAVSADGSEVFFTAPDPYAESTGNGCWGGEASPQTNPPQLYLHSTTPSVTGTVELSKPEKGVSDPTCALLEEACHPAVYVGASENGSKVFFISEGELTSEAVSLKLEDPELYECEIIQEKAGASCKLTRISAGENNSPVREAGSTSAHVWTVPTVSNDGSEVYFTAFGALAPGASALNVENPGPVNLYRYDTETSKTVYVTTVNTLDYPENNQLAWDGHAHMSIDFGGGALEARANWYATPDGHYLLFAARSEPPDGYSTVEAGAGDCPVYSTEHSAPLGHCSEVYRYDTELPVSQDKPGVPNNPVCVSCDPSGALPVSNAFFATTAASKSPAGGAVRAMSDNGSCVFFDSADPLVKQAQNQTLDVYEWEAYGSGHCETNPSSGISVCELAQGCIYLISSGDDPTPSYFVGADSKGNNVFFGTHARLAPQDNDESGDLYDARIGGGFSVPSNTGPCEGNTCQNPVPTPIDATPSSLTFIGPENINETKSATTRAKTLTNAEKLKDALKACKKKPKARRKKCETEAHKHYPTKTKKAKKAAVRARHATSGKDSK